MGFSRFGLIGGLVIAKSKGAPKERIFGDALVAAMINPAVVGIAFAGALAQKQARSGAGPVISQTGTNTAAGIPGLQSTGASGRLKAYGIMPNFHGMRREQAEQFAILLGLNVQVEGPGDGIVTWQEPGIGKRIVNNLLKLKLDD